MKGPNQAVKKWMYFILVAQGLFLLSFIFCSDLYIEPITWIYRATTEESAWLRELPPRYSRNIDMGILVGVYISAGIVGIGSQIGIFQLVFEKKYRLPIRKQKIIMVFFFGGITIGSWLLYCQYGLKHYSLALNMVIPEILSLMLLAFILPGRKRQKASS